MEWKSAVALVLVLIMMPTVAAGRDFSRASVVIRTYNNYGIPANDLLAARMHVDRIFKGAMPGTLPITQPTRFELLINLKAAKALGL